MSKSKEKEFHALVNLVDEPDSEMYFMIENRILEHGLEIMPVLQEAIDNSFSELAQQRLNHLINRINVVFVKDELVNWKKMGASNLMHALFLIAKYRHVRLDMNDVKSQIAEIQHDIWIEINNKLTLLEKIKVFNHVLYDIHGFKPNRSDYYNPSNSYINEVLQNKTGNPILLASVYIILAQNLGLPVYGANSPDHFICVVINKGESDSMSFLPEGEPLFYINPFSNGALFTKIQLSAFLKQIKVEEKPEYFLPCSNFDIALRVLNNLSEAYKRRNTIVEYQNRYTDIEEIKRVLIQ